MRVKIQKLNKEAIIPFYAKPGDAGMDLTAISIVKTDNYIEYYTGLSVEIPEGYVGLIFPRSSISNKDLALANAVGVIDSGYRGEILCRFKRANKLFEPVTLFEESDTYKVGEKVAQIVILPYPQIEFYEAELSESERGDGGFGHTGK